MRSVNMFDLNISLDLEIEYDYDPVERFIELTSVKWYGVDIVEMIDNKTYDDIVEYIADEDLHHEE